jgi:hypothetical protein
MLTQLQDQASTNTSASHLYPAFSGCTSLHQFIARSVEFLHEYDIIEATRCGEQSINAGMGVDTALVNAHIEAIERVGLPTFISNMSNAVRPITVHPQNMSEGSLPLRYELPIPSHFNLSSTSIPYRHEILTVQDSSHNLSGLAQHAQSIIGSPSGLAQHANLEPPAEPMVLYIGHHLPEQRPLSDSAFASATPLETLQLLALHGGPIVTGPWFKPNYAIPIYPTPEPVASLTVSLAKDHRAGVGLILPTALVQAQCTEHGVTLHSSPSRQVPKRGSSAWRTVTDYSFPEGSAINDPLKKEALSGAFTRIFQPQLSDTCQLIVNASEIFPPAELAGLRLDVKTAFGKNRVHPDDVCLLALPFTSDGTNYLFLPLTERFGCQDSNYHWQLVALHVQNKSTIRCIEEFGKPLSAVQTDDFFAIGSQSFLDRERRALEHDADTIICPHSIAHEKTILAAIIEISGYLFNCPKGTVSLSESTFAKLIDLFFLQLKDCDKPGSRVSITILQRAQSFVIRCSAVLLAGKSFSRGFSRNLANVPSSSTGFVNLTARSATDIWMWRVLLVLAMGDSRWITIPVTIPIIFCRGPSESLENLANRQAAHATHILYGDACTVDSSTGTRINGLGTYIPSMGWSQTKFIDDTIMDQSLDINVLEFIASIMAVIQLFNHLVSNGLPTHNVHCHVWSDNTSCLSWMRTNRASHPLHLFLLQIFSLIQIRSGMVITMGHVPGVLNIYADAASRYFRCTNGQAIREHLHSLPSLALPATFIADTMRIAKLQSSDISNGVLESLIALDRVIGAASQP